MAVPVLGKFLFFHIIIDKRMCVVVPKVRVTSQALRCTELLASVPMSRIVTVNHFLIIPPKYYATPVKVNDSPIVTIKDECEQALTVQIPSNVRIGYVRPRTSFGLCTKTHVW